MRKLSRIVAAAALLLALDTVRPMPVTAQTAPSPDAMQQATELFSLMNRDLLAGMANQLSKAFWPAIERGLQGKLNASQLADLRGEFEKIQMQNLTQVMKDVPAIYARRFSAAELRELTAFYRTQTGQKMLREMPQIMADTMATVTPRMQEIEQQSMEAFQRVLRERGI